MKTITEFSGFTLKDSIAKKAALLAEGKTEEEAQTAINELLKLLDETKVSFYKNAIDMSKSRIDQVKRVVVAVKSTDAEKVPEAFSEREGNFYLVEFFPQAGMQSRGRQDDRDERGGRGFKGRDGGRGNPRGEKRGEGRGEGRGDRQPRGDRPDRAPRGDRPAFIVGAATGAGTGAGTNSERKPRPPKSNQPRAPREPREPRAPRAPRPVQGPKGAAELRLVLKGQNPSTLQGSGSGDAAAVASTEGQQG
jgi:hypothetical protein